MQNLSPLHEAAAGAISPILTIYRAEPGTSRSCKSTDTGL